jgi:hypothetical protein
MLAGHLIYSTKPGDRREGLQCPDPQAVRGRKLGILDDRVVWLVMFAPAQPLGTDNLQPILQAHTKTGKQKDQGKLSFTWFLFFVERVNVE